jgi:hypothetical protein
VAVEVPSRPEPVRIGRRAFFQSSALSPSLASGHDSEKHRLGRLGQGRRAGPYDRGGAAGVGVAGGGTRRPRTGRCRCRRPDRRLRCGCSWRECLPGAGADPSPLNQRRRFRPTALILFCRVGVAVALLAWSASVHAAAAWGGKTRRTVTARPGAGTRLIRARVTTDCPTPATSAPRRPVNTARREWCSVGTPPWNTTAPPTAPPRAIGPLFHPSVVLWSQILVQNLPMGGDSLSGLHTHGAQWSLGLPIGEKRTGMSTPPPTQ